MKGLYKKISAGVLALALVLVGSLSQGAMAYAHSESERWQCEINQCKYELEKPHKPSNSPWVREMEEESNDRLLRDYQSRYHYKVLEESNQDFMPGEENYYLKKYYASAWELVDCLEFHLEKHRPIGYRYYNIGGKYYKIYFEKINSK